MTFEDIIIPGEIVIVNGEKAEKDIFVFALSTCQWCRKGKQWLSDNNYGYKFVDVDLLPIEEKRNLKKQLMEFFDATIRYPFIVVDGKDFYAGYNPENWVPLLE
ncbi:MAG: glutaredoxin [Candidatus Heimdallarchaeota archaeon]|nr:glutaredoxin [Candidatus Heimdallarchaeota archaeon]